MYGGLVHRARGRTSSRLGGSIRMKKLIGLAVVALVGAAAVAWWRSNKRAEEQFEEELRSFQAEDISTEASR